MLIKSHILIPSDQSWSVYRTSAHHLTWYPKQQKKLQISECYFCSVSRHFFIPITSTSCWVLRIHTHVPTYLCDADGARAHPNPESVHPNIYQVLGLLRCHHVAAYHLVGWVGGWVGWSCTCACVCVCVCVCACVCVCVLCLH